MLTIDYNDHGFVSIKETTRLIRHVLKESFPRTKFSVRLEKYAGGSHTNVTWTDGPTEAQVEEVCKLFKTKRWDSQSECYDYTYRLWQGERISFAGSGVYCARNLSGGVRDRFKAEAEVADPELIERVRKAWPRVIDPASDTLFSFLARTTSFEDTQPCTFLAMFSLNQPTEPV